MHIIVNVELYRGNPKSTLKECQEGVSPDKSRFPRGKSE